MALSANSQPDFTTIAYFIRSMEEEIIIIFRNILLVCSEMNLISGDMFALDGCKLSSNASKEWSGTFNDLENKKEKIEKTIQFLVKKHRKTDKEEEKTKPQKQKEKEQIQKLKMKVQKIETFLKEQYKKMGSRGKEIQSNITDNESGKMKTSHGVLQGYNGIAIADEKNQVIIAAEAFGGGPESEHLPRMVTVAKDNFKAAGLKKSFLKNKIFIADTGNFSETNLKYLAKEKINAYIPDQQFRKRDPRFATRERHKPARQERFNANDFTYDKKNNNFICPAGKKLKYERNQRLKNTEGKFYRASQADCKRCKMKNKCLKTEKSRQRSLHITYKYWDRNYSDEMKKKIDTDEGRDIYSKRMGIIEPVFGNIENSKGLDKFTLRTKSKVTIQWLLFCMIHNIEKICNYGELEPVFE